MWSLFAASFKSMQKTELFNDPLWPRAGDWPVRQEADLMIVGVPTWRTSLSKTGAGVTPDAIRDAIRRYSDHVVQGSDQLVINEAITVADVGDIEEPDLDEEAATAQIRALASASQLIVALGGDNALTVPVARGAGAAGVITLDAHHDLRDGRSNGSPIRRLIEGGIDPKKIVQIGIADFANSKAYRDRANELGITIFHRDELLARPIAQVMAEALEIAGAGGGVIHVDLDVDVCDRSVVPACPASIPGGISAAELRAAARIAAAHSQVKSIDIAEVDATADAPDGRTVRLAALLVLEAAAGLAQKLRA